jgi:hypothetical protein
LYPIFKPPGTFIVANIFAIYILGGFLWDWLVTIGWLPTKPGEKYLRIENLIIPVAVQEAVTPIRTIRAHFIEARGITPR